MARDHYEVLGVGRDAGAEEIQAAYRRLARANHPDVNRDPAAEDRFKEINDAYHVLADPSSRRRYDRFGDDHRRVPEDWEERVSRAGAAAGSPASGTRGAPEPGSPTSAGRGSTSRTCWAGCSAGAAGPRRWAAPTRRPRSR
nr:DnaJ domain-containing protein [Pseudonocardia sp. AL041005-10]